MAQLFGKGPRRNIRSHFGAFNIQCKFGANWHLLLNHFSSFHFSKKIDNIFLGVKEDGKVARNKFLECLETLEVLEKG